MTSPAVQRFHELLVEHSIPVEGVSQPVINSGERIRVDFAPNATTPQRELAARLAAEFKWNELELMSPSDLLPAVQQLTPAQKATLLDAMLCEWILTHSASPTVKALKLNLTK